MARVFEDDRCTMKEDFKLLIFGDIYNSHIIRFVKYLKLANKSCHIDIISLKKENEILDQDYIDCFDNIFVFCLSRRLSFLPVVSKMMTLFKWKAQIRMIAKKRRYDIVNLHYPSPIHSYLLPDIKKLVGKIVVTPWGSDVYRVKNKQKKRVQIVFDNADYVTGGGDRFTKDFMHIFNVPEKKFLKADLGSEMIDYIIDNKDSIDVFSAKEHFGLSDYYIITCAYNASPEQHHEAIIDAIDKVRYSLPENLCLLFPMSYPRNNEYIERIKRKVSTKGIKSLFVERYLDLSELFVLRQATDMFIHVQTTDANCTSLREYLLCKKKVINGGWLRYDELEAEGIVPYFVAQDLQNLGNTVITAFNSLPLPISKTSYKIIEGMGCKKAGNDWNKLFSFIS